MNDQDCYKLYQDANLDTTEDMQCFGTRYNGPPQGACNGDSGGPLQCYIQGKWYFSGIVSFGASKCDTDIASIYAKVHHPQVHDFITTTIADNS